VGSAYGEWHLQLGPEGPECEIFRRPRMVPQALRIAALTIVACFAAAMAAKPDDVAPLLRKVATAAFAGRALPFDQRIAKRVSDWFAHHR
jgi:hypothetical protein